MNILIIEDSKSTGQIIQSILENNGFKTRIMHSKNFQQKYLEGEKFELVVMNINLENSSTKILKSIKSFNLNLRVVGVATKSTWKEKVEFLNNYGDDVIDYPFPIQEIIARINALVRRPSKKQNTTIRVDNIVIDSDLKMATVNNKEIPLRRREFELLEYMVKNKNRTISRAELLDHVWDYRKMTASNTVDVHVKRLRDKLPKRNYIKTVHGYGYTVNRKIP